MRLLAGLITCLAVPAVLSVANASPNQVGAHYSVTWRSLEIISVSTALSIDEDRYQLTFDTSSVGVLDLFFPFESQGSATGVLAASGPLPLTFSGTRNLRDELRSWRLTFDEDGSVLERDVDAGLLAGREPVPPELWRGPDPMSLTLQAMLEVGPGAELSGRAFDGRRVFDAGFACSQDVERPEQATGDELRCEIRGNIVSGTSDRWRERNRDQPADRPIIVWLSQGIIADTWWPVRMQVETRFGTVMATLVTATEQCADTTVACKTLSPVNLR